MVEWLLYGCNAGRPFHLSCQSFFFFLVNLAYLKLHVLGVPTRDWLDFVVVIVGALPLGHQVDVVEECSKVLRRFLHVIAWLTKRWISCFRNMQHTRNIRRQTLNNNKKIYKIFATAKQWNNLIITMLIIVLVLIIIIQQEEENHSDLYSYILYMYKGIMYRDG